LTLKLSFAFGAKGLKQIDFSQLALVNDRTLKSAASIPPTLATLTADQVFIPAHAYLRV
jgi:hypothetical protein